ncbi:tyrosine-type recombinase/integrase [Paenibacillus sp. FSL M7-1046]|uniref:tyrosine-type recombinase/integrase n=1 Tax=Paenibacillus sp. FSL M7-1046 TaxID=2975315 RepID=UPI0030F4B492
MLNKLDDDGYEFNTISGVHVTANMIYKWAIDEKLRTDNPCSGTKIPVRQLTVEQMQANALSEKYLVRSEIEEFLAATEKFGKGDDLEVFYLLVFSGLRPGELCALQWADIYFETYDLDVNKTIYYPRGVKGEFMLTPPKNEGSVRRFDIDKFIIDKLLIMKERQEKRHERYKENHSDFYEGNFVLTDDDGLPFTLNKLNDRMQRIIKRTKITKNATAHIWRHTHISMLAEAGVDVKTIMKWVGHTNCMPFFYFVLSTKGINSSII